MSLPHHPEDDDVPLGGGPGAGDPMFEDVDDENIGCRADGFGIDKHKFGHDEELDIGRIGEDRAHLDNEFSIPDCSDHSGRGVGGKWTEANPEIAVNGSKRQQFKLCQTELEQVKAQGKNVSNNLARHDIHIMDYFYGPRSVLSLLFQRRLGWNHQKFLLFIATNTKSKASQLYSSDFTQDTSNLMDISEEGVSKSTSISSTSLTLFWEEVETEVNKIFRELHIVGRSGKMICLTDDDKIHYEWHSLHNNTIRNLSFEDATDATEDTTTLGDTVVDDDTSL